MREGETLGGYELRSELGRGGMGIVYTAHHSDHGRVALKTVAQPRALALRSLRSEIAILSRLRHPGVVRILDHGVEGDRPWMAMELVVGHPLSVYLSQVNTLPQSSNMQSARGLTTQLTHSSPSSAYTDTQTHPPAGKLPAIDHDVTLASKASRPPSPKLASGPHTALAQPRVEPHDLLRWLYRACQTLAYIHGQGIVHADIKPGNILITNTGRVVLVDFGLATFSGNRVKVRNMELAGLLAGSLPYINPEQIRGDVLDPRADLYSMGCILYETLMGQPPFGSDASDPSALMAQHVRTPPPTPSSDIPELDHLVASLLSKDCQDRPGHAQAVLHALQVANVAYPWSDLPDQAMQPYLYRPGLAGRDLLLEHLNRALVQAQGRQGALLLLRGESGVGKTRVALEMIRKARQTRSGVLIGHASDKGQPLELFVPILRTIADHCLERGAHTTAAIFEPEDLALLAPYAPFVGNLPRLNAQAPLPVLADLPMNMAWLRLFRGLTRVLERYCHDNTTLFVLDDVHWADPLSLAALDHLSRGLERTRWLMLATYRAEEVSPELQDLLDDAPCTVFHVERLEESDIVHIMTQMLGQPPGDTLVQVVSVKANGNPFFVAEYLQTMVESGRLRLDALDRWTLHTTADEHGLETLPEPQSVQSLIQTRLERLAHHTRRLTQMAAVWGRRVNRRTLETLSDMGSYRFQNTLDALVQHQIFEPDPADSTQVQFVHDTIREVAYDQLDPELRAHLHRQVAQHLEHQSAQHPNDGVPFGMLARHWSQAHEPTLARTYFVKAALYAAQRWALADAHRHFQSALALYAPDDPDTIAIRLDLVEHVLLKLGHNAQVIQQAEQALEQAEQALETLQHDATGSPQQPQLHRMQARAHIALGQVFALRHLKQEHQYDEALAHTERGLSLAEVLDDDSLKAQALENLGHITVRQSDWSTSANAVALRSYKAALELWRTLKDQTRQASVIHAIGVIHSSKKQVHEALACFQQALSLQDTIEDRHGAAITWFDIGFLHADQHNAHDAMRAYNHAKERFAELGNRSAEAITLNNIAILYMDDHCDYHQALKACTRSLQIRETIGSNTTIVKNNLALVYGYLGQFTQAKALLEEAFDQAYAEGGQQTTLVGLFHTLAMIGRLSGDLELLSNALRLDLADPSTHQGNRYHMRLFTLKAHLHRCRGELSQAEACIQLALEDAHNQAIYTVVQSRAELGRLLIDQERWDEARTLLDSMLAMMLDTPERCPRLQAELFLNRGRLNRLTLALDMALQDTTQALSLFQALNMRSGTASALCERAYLAKAMGESGLPWLEKAQAEADSIGLSPESEVQHELEHFRRHHG